MIVVLMGVSGAGKTTVGEALARELGWEFIDADEFHPPANVAKMAAGTPLDDADRWPWLDLINETLRARHARGHAVVLACSALKEAYRRRLARNLDVRFVHLHAPFEVIRDRLARRAHRYMPASLLESQFAALEPPADAMAVDVSGDPAGCVRRIAAALKG